MTTTNNDAPLPVVQALLAARAYCALLNCVDLERWGSLAQPQVRGLAQLAFIVVGELETALSADFDLDVLDART
ncbi:hypothetical protein [Phenylobacterium sp.]|uniref:hypothetical protein n=1 Tax=Phenylobacterium sp. TaxID=1871053 RepID=UPI0037C58F02